uniref:NSF attachment protein alpha n=2 Tax=Neoaves TaxID=3078114 RepID=A0A8B9M2V8_9AVES
MDQAGKEKEALQLLAEADKKVRGSQSFFAGLFGGSSRIEEACDIYARAANMFKMAKNWSAAGNAFCQAAQLHLQLQSKHDAATNFVDAGNAFKKADPQEAINCLIRAIEIYTDMGRFTIAAKHHISIAEIYETELVDIEKAIAHYEQAADYYKGEESNSSANKCLLKVATYAAQLEQYQKAVEIYEQVGTSAMDSPLLKYSAKEYFFKAALCHFCIDMLNAKLAVQKYEEMFPAFTDSRECKLVKKLLDAHEEQNIDGYTDAVGLMLVPVTCGNSRQTRRWKEPPPPPPASSQLLPSSSSSSFLPLPGEGIRLHLPAGPVAHHHAAPHQEDHPGRGGGLTLGSCPPTFADTPTSIPLFWSHSHFLELPPLPPPPCTWTPLQIFNGVIYSLGARVWSSPPLPSLCSGGPRSPWGLRV